MTGWLFLTPQQRISTLEQASVRSGIQTKAIEKDWWVTLSLKALFSTPYASFCMFKGGTSLSKGWKLIQRFSEDVDIALAPEAFGMEYVTAPSHSYVKNLKRKGCEFTSKVLKAAIEKAFDDLGVPAGMITVVADDIREKQPDKDPQTIFIRYPSLFEAHEYLADEVKMEFGVRSLKEPFSTVTIESILSESFPNQLYEEIPFEIMAVEPRKTMLEKILLLHEKFSLDYAASKIGDRQSRHLYDLAILLKTPAATEVLEDEALFKRLIEHRKHYVRLPGIDYTQLQSHTIDFIPGIVLHEFFHIDYTRMQQAMIYGNSPGFEDILQQLKVFNGRLRLMNTHHDLDELIEKFLQDNANAMKQDLKYKYIYTAPVQLQTDDGKFITAELTMHKNPYDWVFEKIEFLEDNADKK